MEPTTQPFEEVHLSDDNFHATASALTTLTQDTTADHSASPLDHMHAPADHEKSHAWIRKMFPTQAVDALETRFHMGNYVIDRTTGQKSFESMSIYVRLGMHLLYYGSAEERVLELSRTKDLLRSESEKMGREYDSPASKAHIIPFIQSFKLEDSMAEMEEPNPENYDCFNSFFARAIKPSARPPAEPSNPLVTSSPADCRLTVFPSIDLATQYWIKGRGFTLARLLGDETLANQFNGGSIAIARLAPQDYHRWHSPVSGTVRGIRDIPGTYYTVNPQAVNEPGAVDVFCENKRSVMMLERDGTQAPIAIVAVGAMLVGSIKYVPGVDQVGARVERSQCLGAFYYGGSTIVVVYPPGEVAFDADLVRNSCDERCETLVRVGWRIGAKE